MFMCMKGGWMNAVRRVSAFYVRLGGAPQEVYRLQEDEDRFEALLNADDLCAALGCQYGEAPGELHRHWDKRTDCLRRLHGEGVRDFAGVRAEVLAAYKSWQSH